MGRDCENTFSNWGGAPSQSQQEKCENAERAVRNAINADPTLSSKSIEVFAQGSYANRTNVRVDSDVDVCVLYTGAFFANYSMSDGLSREALGFTEGKYDYVSFKNDVGQALTSFFGAKSVTRGNKAFDVHANTYRIDADVVPCFEHRRYMGTVQNFRHLAGTELSPDKGPRIVNWPRQNYSNGVAKNTDTGRRFKAVTRIFKRLRNEMAEAGCARAEPIPSYLLECLAWNVPNGELGHSSLTEDVRHAIAHLWSETRVEATCSEWGEVNELKYLFRANQPWTREAVNAFLQDAWNYIGFK